MKSRRRSVLIGLIVLFSFLGLFFSGDIYAAGKYPSRPITLVVPFLPGGMSDLNARMFAERLEKVLKQPVVVLNKGGGATTVGGYAVASAKPDGYTLGFLPDVTIYPEAFSFFFDAPYSSKDLKPISNILSPVIAYMVKGDAPWNSMKELIEYAKKSPGVTVGIHGKMTPSFTALAVLNRVEKTGFVEVPLESDAKIIPAVLGGHIQVGATGWPPSKSLYEAKKIKILVLISPNKRVDFAPEIPTLAELGYKIASFPIYGIMGPKGIPDEVVKVIDEAVRKVSEDPQFRAKAHDMGSEVTYQDSASFEKSLAKAKETYQIFLKQEGLSK